MTTITWANAISGDWSTAADWSGGVVPAASDDVLIGDAGPYSVTVSSGEAAMSLELDAAGATLAVASGGSLAIGSTLDLTAGTLDLAAGGAIDGGTLAADGGVVAWNGGTLAGVTFQGVLDMSVDNSALVVGSAGIVLEGAGGVGRGEVDLTGEKSVMRLAGSQTLDGATITLGAAATLETGGSLTIGPGLVLDQIGANAVLGGVPTGGQGVLPDSITNRGTILAAGGARYFYIGGAGGRQFITNFTNLGDLEAGGKELTYIGASTVANKGAVDITAGAVIVYTYDGSVDGGGLITNSDAIDIGVSGGGGNLTLTAKSIINSGAIDIGAGAGVRLAGNFFNYGTVAASYGEIVLECSIALAGELDVTHSKIVMYGPPTGAETTAGLIQTFDLFVGENNAFALNCPLQNAGQTLTVGSNTPFGTVSVFRGVINGGTINDLGDGFIWSEGTLNGVTYEGALDLAASNQTLAIGPKGLIAEGRGGSGPGLIQVTGSDCALSFLSDPVITGLTIDISGAGDWIYFRGTETFATSTLNLGDGENLYLQPTGRTASRLTITAGGVLSASGANATLMGARPALSTLVNQGTIEVSASGGPLTVENLSFSNTGQVQVAGYASLVIAASTRLGNLTAGTFTGGAWTVGSGGSLVIQTGASSGVTTDAAFIGLDGPGSVFDCVAAGGTIALETSSGDHRGIRRARTPERPRLVVHCGHERRGNLDPPGRRIRSRQPRRHRRGGRFRRDRLRPRGQRSRRCGGRDF